jgi:pyruvate kinase
MGRIAERAEQELLADGLTSRRHAVTQRQIPDVVAHGAARSAEELGAAAILALTHKGHTARVLSKYKPKVPILAATSRPDTCRRLGLLWGVTPVLAPFHEDEWAALGAVRDAVLAKGLLQPKDVVVVVNSRAGVRGFTNTLRIAPLKELGPAGEGATPSPESSGAPGRVDRA